MIIVRHFFLLHPVPIFSSPFKNDSIRFISIYMEPNIQDDYDENEASDEEVNDNSDYYIDSDIESELTQDDLSEIRAKQLERNKYNDMINNINNNLAKVIANKFSILLNENIDKISVYINLNDILNAIQPLLDEILKDRSGGIMYKYAANILYLNYTSAYHQWTGFKKDNIKIDTTNGLLYTQKKSFDGKYI